MSGNVAASPASGHARQAAVPKWSKSDLLRCWRHRCLCLVAIAKVLGPPRVERSHASTSCLCLEATGPASDASVGRPPQARPRPTLGRSHSRRRGRMAPAFLADRRFASWRVEGRAAVGRRIDCSGSGSGCASEPASDENVRPVRCSSFGRLQEARPGATAGVRHGELPSLSLCQRVDLLGAADSVGLWPMGRIARTSAWRSLSPRCRSASISVLGSRWSTCCGSA